MHRAALAGHLGIARNVLSGRLSRLVEAGLVERRAYQEPGSAGAPATGSAGPGAS